MKLRISTRHITHAWRWAFNVKCREPFCNARRRCWLWRVEVEMCPTCKRDAAEYEDAFSLIFDAILDAKAHPVEFATAPVASTWAAGTGTYVITHNTLPKAS